MSLHLFAIPLLFWKKTDTINYTFHIQLYIYYCFAMLFFLIFTCILIPSYDQCTNTRTVVMIGGNDVFDVHFLRMIIYNVLIP